MTDPIKLTPVIHDIDQALTADTDGTPISDFVFALRGIRAESLGPKTPSHPETIGDTSYVIGDPGMPQL